MTALIPNKIVLMSNCPYSEVSHQVEFSDWSPIAMSLHRECPYIRCPRKEKLLYSVSSIEEVHSSGASATHLLVRCRLLAVKQTEQQRVLQQQAHSNHVHLQRQQHASQKHQADQDGPGDLRPDGQR